MVGSRVPPYPRAQYGDNPDQTFSISHCDHIKSLELRITEILYGTTHYAIGFSFQMVYDYFELEGFSFGKTFVKTYTTYVFEKAFFLCSLLRSPAATILLVLLLILNLPFLRLLAKEWTTK